LLLDFFAFAAAFAALDFALLSLPCSAFSFFFAAFSSF
jgi:hypothetical protein